MSFIKDMSLRLKFIGCLVLSAFILGACLSIIMYFHFNSIMESEISHRSEMLLAQAKSVQDYVKTELRPEMFKIVDDDGFVLKAMSSSYISRKVMERLNKEGQEDIYYRRVSLNARNPLYEPTSFEKSIIEKFKKDGKLKFWEEDSEFKGVKYHLVSTPVKFTKSCMSCHGNPEDAPLELKEIYGDKAGFFHNEGDVDGVVVAGFPVRMITDPVKEVTIQYFSLYIFWLLLFSCIIGLFFDRLVMKNLKKLGMVFEVRFSGEKEKRIIRKLEKKDEIEGLIEGVDELAACLFNANKKLEEHSINLEEKVRERTKALEVTAEKHSKDLRLFSRLIARFTESIDSENIIRDALERIGTRYNAVQVVYFCTVVSENFFPWKEDDSIKRPDSKIKEILWSEKLLFVDNKIYIPVLSHESQWGILSLVFDYRPDESDFDEKVLLSLGLQLGSSLENIQAVSELKYQNDLLESVFEGISDPLVLIDIKCREIYSNRGSRLLFSDMKAFEREAFLREILIDSKDSPISKLNTGIIPVVSEISTKEKRFFRVYLYPLPKRESGGDLRIVMYARDITIEKELMEGMQQAEKLSAIGRMAAGMAHEINNPLGVIKCYSDLLSDSIDDEKQLADINVILSQTGKVQKIVKNLLNLSRHKNVISGKCRINSIVVQIMDIFLPQAGSREIEMNFFPGEDIPEIKCDGSILEQIITNIILNSFDALKPGGKIEITTKKENEFALLEVHDNGSGINESVINNIFDPFFTTKDVGKGTGLGLSVVYGFITELGGRVEVENDEGTIFKLYFPYYDKKGELDGI